MLALSFLFFVACSGTKGMDEAAKRRAQLCKPVEVTHSFHETPYKGGTAQILSFQTIRANLNSACATCHSAPARNGGFTYIDSWQGREVTISGVTAWYPGFSEVAEKMREYIFHADEAKRMPPPAQREKNPESFLTMGRQIDAWIAAGKPNGSFEVGKAPEERPGKFRPTKPAVTSDLGDCVPTAKAIGYDYSADRFFENTQVLPKYLTDTDLFTLDPLQLAEHGTVAYNVEYPLWADNADKGRWIHVPMKLEKGELNKQAVVYNSATRQFEIPENTRFYKTFYRAITLPNKKVRMRRMETRIIVARTPWEKSLFGTYQWDDTEQVATLVEAPYRDGTPFKDLVYDVVVDEEKTKIRPYAIPGRQRCLDCHRGSPNQNMVLGFIPLQINKRPFGAAGRLDPAYRHDLDQVERFISYGLLKGISSAEDLPVLENAGTARPRNIHEIRANGYMVGNCYHCHNPNGLAFAKENGIQLALGPGDIFSFNTNQRSVQISTRKLVHQNGELDASHIWRKITDSAAQQGLFSQMPMHTPGGPDCRVMLVIGKWIRSFESEAAADQWYPECKKENPFQWIDMDFTWPKSEVYVPRRNDWKDLRDGMPQSYRDIELTPALKEAIRTEYPVGYWLKKPICKFPDVDLPPEKRRPWMMNGDRPKRPFGEVHYSTPGSYFFRNTCMKCHGPRADGDTSLARGILNWSGGSVRVANLIDGLFGKQGENLRIFDLDGKNYAGQYLIWMAMEGTRVKFPPEVSSFMGKHGGQMLNGVREKCLAQISSSKRSTPVFMDHEIFNKVCFMENLDPSHPGLQFDPATDKPLHPDVVEKWLDRGAWNAGWAIFEYLAEASSTGIWRPGLDQCELIYGGEGK